MLFLFCPVQLSACRIASFQAIMLKIVVKLAHDSVGSLATITCVIRKKVDLARDTFTGHSKNAALSGCEKVDGTWLHGLRWVMHLLGIIKRIVCPDVPGVCRCV